MIELVFNAIYVAQLFENKYIRSLITLIRVFKSKTCFYPNLNTRSGGLLLLFGQKAKLKVWDLLKLGPDFRFESCSQEIEHRLRLGHDRMGVQRWWMSPGI